MATTHHIRWTLRRDLPQVIAAEVGLPDAWTEDDYLMALRHRQTISMVAEDFHTDAILGVMVYELFQTKLRLVRLVVNPANQRQGVGQALIAKLVHKVCSHRREAIYACVPESNLAMQLFLRSCAFESTAVLSGQCCYLMEMRPSDAVYESFGYHRPVNRIAIYYDE